MNLKIRDKIIGIMVLLVLLPILLLGVTSYTTSRNALKTQNEELGTVIADQANVLIQEKIHETNKLLNVLSTEPHLANIGEETNLNYSKAQFERTKENYNFIDVYFGTIGGDLIMTLGEDDGSIVPQERPWYIDASQSDGVIWSQVYKDEDTGGFVVTASKAVYDGSALKGVLAIDIDLGEFSKIITEVDIMGGYPIVMDLDGTILVDKMPEGIGNRFEGIDGFDLDNNETQIQEYTYESADGDMSADQLIIFQDLEGIDWKVATIVGVDALGEVTGSMRRNILLIGLAAVMLGVVVSVLFGRHIAHSIHQILRMIKRMEEGDFTARINTKNTDEFGQLRDGFNTMMDTISGFIGKIKLASTSVDEYSSNLAAISEEVNASSYEVSRTAEEIAKGASNQANDTEQGVILVNNMSDKLLELDSTSESMVGLAEEIRTTNEDGVIIVDDLKEKTQRNNDSSKRVEEEIMELDRRISEVSEILSTIDAISEQTNLLALNASIEAARAGEYGKGFAVVADEIRQLAAESKESSNNIKQIIEAVQTESKRTVEVMGEVNEINTDQTEAVDRVSSSFETINSLIGQVVSQIKEIDQKSTQMNRDRNSIVETIENISAVSQETAAASEEVTASIEEQTSATEEVANSANKLNELANELNREIDVFRV